MPREDWRASRCAPTSTDSPTRTAVRVEAHDRNSWSERLCAALHHPAGAFRTNRQVHNAAGRVEAQTENAVARRHDASGLAALEFMQRLAALVPRPRLHTSSASMASWRRTPASQVAGGASGPPLQRRRSAG